MKKITIYIILCFALGIFLFTSLFYIDRLVVSLISTSSGLNISYKKWNGSLLKIAAIQNLKVSSEMMTFESDKAVLDFLLKESLSKHKLIWNCCFYKLSLEKPAGAKKTTSGVNPILTPLINAKIKFDTSNFQFTLEKDKLKVSNFKLAADGINITGDTSIFFQTKDFDLILALYFSQEKVKQLFGDLSDMILVRNNDGVYFTNISSKGNLKTHLFHVKSDLIEINIIPQDKKF
ncbi:hypothetical protein OMAG_002023 [Candidatus Omnitrophus magneticus]|uniref:Uncharacterized protein n=1 Tax=Candidatus Omnitrophus magneticus TaxID=1609969 RepID=A0A0F0CRG9_9BACT|nr:hypothetical protein OMAG_002023 [Candidatus Omnitrophus magneticus]